MTDLPELGENRIIGGVVVKVTDDWIVAVLPQIFNDRIALMSHYEWRHGWTAGYCYDKGAAAGLAAEVWDPETQRHPAGFKKCAGDGRPGFAIKCSYCDSRPTWETREEAEAAAVWHVYERHPELWLQEVGDRLPKDFRPTGTL